MEQVDSHSDTSQEGKEDYYGIEILFYILGNREPRKVKWFAPYHS